jgi:hypothetical protein
MMFAWFEHGRGKGYVREEFLYLRKHRKDYRLEAKWEENDVKCFDVKSWLVGAQSGANTQAVVLWGGGERNSPLPD